MSQDNHNNENELIDHDYDGIQEYDNSLPPWWLILFYFTIVWGVVYVLYYHTFDTNLTQEDEYNNAMADHHAKYAEKSFRTLKDDEPAPQEELPMVVSKDPKTLEAAGKVYVTNCAACHGVKGEGTVGPNLVDEYWVHGGEFADIVKVITNGIPAKGMVPWGSILKKKEIYDVTSYILNLQGTNPPNAKAPEGKKVN